MGPGAEVADALHRFSGLIEHRLRGVGGYTSDRADVRIMTPLHTACLDAFVESSVLGWEGVFCRLITVPLHELGLDPLDRLRTAVLDAGHSAAFVGFAHGASLRRPPDHALAIVSPHVTASLGSAPTEFEVRAIVTAYNEADVIRSTVMWLLDQEIKVTVIDNWSVDGTADRIADLVDDGRVDLVRFPHAGPPDTYQWRSLLEYVSETAWACGADWVVHHDADQRHDSPWPGLTYRDALWSVDRMGFDAVDHTCINFRPVDDGYVPGTELTDHFRFFEFETSGAFRHVQAWKNAQPVDLASSGGHDVWFEGRRLFPYNFTLRHVPIRSQAHGEQKVFRDRLPRYRRDELDKGWHHHYQRLRRQHRFIREPAELLEYRDGSFEEDFLLERLSGLVAGSAPSRASRIRRSLGTSLGRTGLYGPAQRALWRARR